jgi:hypothetical protein
MFRNITLAITAWVAVCGSVEISAAQQTPAFDAGISVEYLCVGETSGKTPASILPLHPYHYCRACVHSACEVAYGNPLGTLGSQVSRTFQAVADAMSGTATATPPLSPTLAEIIQQCINTAIGQCDQFQ